MLVEKKQLELKLENEGKARIQNQKLEIQIKNVEGKLKKQENDYIEKQRTNEIKRKQFEDQRKIKNDENHYQQMRKNLEIQKVLKKESINGTGKK